MMPLVRLGRDNVGVGIEQDGGEEGADPGPREKDDGLSSDEL